MSVILISAAADLFPDNLIISYIAGVVDPGPAHLREGNLFLKSRHLLAGKSRLRK
jgi:hypothetical protein